MQEATPTFLRLLLDPQVKTVLVSGCGGGADFLHGTHFFPMLAAAGKRVILHSYSFGDPTAIAGSVPFTEADVPPNIKVAPILDGAATASGWPAVRIVTHKCEGPHRYNPEVLLASYIEQAPFAASLSNYGELKVKLPALAAKLPTTKCRNQGNAPAPAAAAAADDAAAEPKFFLYASYARDWTAAALRNFYNVLALSHSIDAFLVVDGGSDSLMKGTEGHQTHGPMVPPGDQIEDAATVAAVFALPDDVAPVRVMCCLGLGCDRFMGCSDADSLAAIAELTAAGRKAENNIEAQMLAASSASEISGFLGVLAMERTSLASTTYRNMVEYLQQRQAFRSVIANSICASSLGKFGDGAKASADLAMRVMPGELDIWPFMSMAFAFDVRLVFRRSKLAWRLLRCKTVPEMYARQKEQRHEEQEEDLR
jgi:hypothetical protein